MLLSCRLGIDPDVPDAARRRGTILGLVVLVFAVSVLGPTGTTIGWSRQERRDIPDQR